MAGLLPLPLLRLAGWRALASEACALAVLDVAALRARSSLLGWGGSTRTPDMFWDVLGAMAPQEQEAVLKFVFARKRLPRQGGPALVLARMGREAPDRSLPMGHTCSGQLDLPDYSSREVMRAALLRAASLCSAFDLDGGASGVQ